MLIEFSLYGINHISDSRARRFTIELAIGRTISSHHGVIKSFTFWDHSIETLEKAIDLRKKIEALQKTVTDIMGSGAPVAAVAKRRGRPPKTAPVESVAAKVDGRKGKRSAATRAKMAAAAKARWAVKKGVGIAEPAVEAPRKKRTMSPEGRARIAAAQRARWAKVKG
jgi:hypothetical protein